MQHDWNPMAKAKVSPWHPMTAASTKPKTEE